MSCGFNANGQLCLSDYGHDGPHRLANILIETRYYIALVGGTRARFKLGPATSKDFKQGANEPLLLWDNHWAYPVSAEIAKEWICQDDDAIDEL